MIIIESYLLKPEKVRAGENLLNTITTYGGHKTNIIINNDGTGEIIYNNSDYTISLSNDLIVGGTSTFTLSNVSNSDTVEFYEDNTLVSTTTGNTVNYTPTIAGEHTIYFKVNNVPTNTMTVTAYTLTSVSYSKIGSDVSNAGTYLCTYLYIGNSTNSNKNFQVTLKPLISEDVTLNNIKCNVTYGSNTYTYNLSTEGTVINIPLLWSSCETTNTLSITVGQWTLSKNIIEYFSVFKKGQIYVSDNFLNLQMVTCDRGTLGMSSNSDNLLLSALPSGPSTAGPEIIVSKDLYDNTTQAYKKIGLMLTMASSNTITILNSDKSSSQSLSVVSGDVLKITMQHQGGSSSSYPLRIYLNDVEQQGLNNINFRCYLSIPTRTSLKFSNLLYGVV